MSEERSKQTLSELYLQNERERINRDHLYHTMKRSLRRLNQHLQGQHATLNRNDCYIDQPTFKKKERKKKEVRMKGKKRAIRNKIMFNM